MNPHGSILTLAAAIFVSWFVFRKSLHKNNRNPNSSRIPPQPSVSSTRELAAAEPALASASASASFSAVDFAGKYEVFLSFRGTDTGRGFTDFLYMYLDGAGISTFRDDNELGIGEEMGPNLLKIIKDSKIRVPILSQNYASSARCLRELAQMVEFNGKEGTTIFPIFYDIEPSHTRNQSGSYEKAFCEHKKNFDEKTVQGWKDALTSVANIAGLVKNGFNRLEGKLVKEVVECVMVKLKKYKYISAPVSSSSVDLPGKYKVFLSFIGEDTGNSITNLLYTNLVDAGIHTFRDGNELRIGEEIGPDRLNIIKDSKISIPIFSKNYASSKLCLSELAQMVECHKTEGQRIFPVFYDIDPSDVCNQKGSYEKAFRRHMKNFDEKTVQEWKDAMTMVGQLKEFKLTEETRGNEGELVNIFIRKVVFWLNNAHVTNNLVGMDDHVEEMERRLDVNSNDVRIVGIHGMGGIGKTTISMAIYNFLRDHFKSYCFLGDIRERSQGHDGIMVLQDQLIRDISPGNHKCYDHCRLKYVLGGRKVLLVLDDVDEISQFNYLVESVNSFCAGSRIVVTTRNKEVLHLIEANCLEEGLVYKSYEPKLLNDHHSLQLFSKYAFRRNPPPEDYLDLCSKVVSNAAGIPFVLVTLGLLFFGNEDKDSWRQKLRELEKVPHELVLEQLRISFEALNYEEKQIFLDIACFFIGKDIAKPCYLWDDCEFYPSVGIDILVLRSLVKVGDDNRFRMDDRLRDLGRQIIQDESLNPGDRSRVWRPEEALDVLKLRLKKKCVEALNLDLGRVELDKLKQFEDKEEKYVQLKIEGKEYYIRRLLGQDFRRLPYLRFLRLGYAFLDGDFKHLFSKLRWLEWRCCGKSIPNNLNLKNLVILDLSNSTITDEWEGWTLFKEAKNLKILNLSSCMGLIRGPCRFKGPLRFGICWRKLCEGGTLGGFESLEHLDMSRCYSLERIPDLLNMGKLKKLSLKGCKKLLEIEGISCLVSLELLDIQCCISIERLPDLSNLRTLKELLLKDCKNLDDIGGLGGLESLENLDMGCCESMERFPDFLNLKGLKKLSLNGCNKLHEIEGFTGFVALELLDIRSCTSIERLPDLSNLRMLKELLLKDCKNLCEVLGLGSLESLEHLDMSGCNSMETLPNLSNMEKLEILSLGGCRMLQID